MSTKVSKVEKQEPKKRTHSAEIASGGISTATQFAGLMSSLMTELLDGDIDPRTANAVVNAGGKLLKVVEMNHRYGRPDVRGDKNLVLFAPTATDSLTEAERSARIKELQEELKLLEAV